MKTLSILGSPTLGAISFSRYSFCCLLVANKNKKSSNVLYQLGLIRILIIPRQRVNIQWKSLFHDPFLETAGLLDTPTHPFQEGLDIIVMP